jgi:ribosomal protein S18 acetylase RimI-like enzyme
MENFMVEIKALTMLDREAVNRIITGYTTTEKYQITHSESETHTTFALELVKLEKPTVVRYHHQDDAALAEYQEILQHNLSLGAYVDNMLVGLALIDPQQWNNSMRVHEFHVAESYRGRGIGQALMNALFEQGRAANYRIVICETQNINVPAIRFYRRMGFILEAIDLSLYTNHDYPCGEVAIFMKYKL